MRDAPELLFSFFTRDNPNADDWVYMGLGPMRRRVYDGALKDKGGKWNYVFANDRGCNIGGVEMPNPDSLVESFSVPAANSELDLVKRLSSSENGQMWLDACRKYREAWGLPVLGEMPFKIEIEDVMPRMYYIKFAGHYPGTNEEHVLEKLPENMIYGRFHPLFGQIRYEKDPSKVGMNINGGVITRGDERGAYALEEGMSHIYLSVPWHNQLLGTMNDEEMFPSSSPREHFMEYVFSQDYARDGEKALCPAFRVEVRPASPDNTTLAREKRWSDERKASRERASKFW